MTDLSPMGRAARAPIERAVRWLTPWWPRPADQDIGRAQSEYLLGLLRTMRAQEPEAFAEFLVFCGLEGQAVVEGRVVELERFSFDWHGTQLYRVKPERSDRHTEDAS